MWIYVDGHLVVSIFCYYDHAAMNIHVYVFVGTYVFTSLGSIPRSGISGSYGNSMFNFFGELPNCFSKQLYHFIFSWGFLGGLIENFPRACCPHLSLLLALPVSGLKDKRHIEEAVVGISPGSIANVSRLSPIPLPVLAEREIRVGPDRV